jgi:hypothetical protein
MEGVDDQDKAASVDVGATARRSTSSLGDISLVAQLSKNEITGAQHRVRFKRWQNLAPRQTRSLCVSVDNRLVPQFEMHGFCRVDVSLRQADSPVRGSEVRLERARDQIVDSISFSFTKFKSPRLQVHFSRRKLTPPHTFLRSANLVIRRSQYYHFWGKPWWLPTRFWSERATSRTVDKLEARIEQLLRFLESGDIGPSISRQDLKARYAGGTSNVT